MSAPPAMWPNLSKERKCVFFSGNEFARNEFKCSRGYWDSGIRRLCALVAYTQRQQKPQSTSPNIALRIHVSHQFYSGAQYHLGANECKHHRAAAVIVTVSFFDSESRHWRTGTTSSKAQAEWSHSGAPGPCNQRATKRRRNGAKLAHHAPAES